MQNAKERNNKSGWNPPFSNQYTFFFSDLEEIFHESNYN